MLWPDDYESLREEARQMATVVASTYAKGDTHLSDPDRDRRVRAQRALVASLEVESPAGVDETIAGVACRVFRPAARPTGVYLHLHGGAMMLGSPRLHDGSNALLCEHLGVTVVSVDYRLAPEHPFPAGADDCLAVAEWLVEHAEPELGSGRLLIGGESAGGYYAALTLLRARDELDAADRFSAANLVFGVYDLSGTPSARGVSPSEAPNVMEPDLLDFVLECFLPGCTKEDARAPSVSPLYADLRGLPPALFTVGTADGLLDDSLFMAARWAAYGNESELAVYPDCVHGFTAFPMQLAQRANDRIETFLAHHLAGAHHV